MPDFFTALVDGLAFQDKVEAQVLDYLQQRLKRGRAKKAVYLVRTGIKAKIGFPRVLDPEVDYYCFTDRNPWGLSPWIFRFLPKGLSAGEIQDRIFDALRPYEKVVDLDAPGRGLPLRSARGLRFFHCGRRGVLGGCRALGARCLAAGARRLDRLFRCFPEPPDSLAFDDNRPVTVIIPVYNGYDVLCRLMRTFFEHTSSVHRVIFIDDASPDPRISPYLSELRAHHPNVSVVTNDANRGFSHNVNLAASLCEGDFVLLNTDTEVPDRWIPRLFAPLWARPETTASVSAMTTCTPSLTVPERGCDGLAFVARHGAFAIDRALSTVRVDFDHDVIRVGVGFCLAISRKAWDSVGGFAEEVFGRGYGEETDWCYRARHLGFECRVAANLFVPHYHNGSFTPEEKKKLLERNRKLVKERNPGARDRDLAFRCEYECARLRAQARWSLRRYGIAYD